MDDAELIARVLDGDVEAFSVLVDRHYGDCSRFAIRLLGNRQDAEDALQEAFISAYQALGRYQERDSFRAWLFRIVVNRCRSLARSRRRRFSRFVNDADAVAGAIGPRDGEVGLGDALQRGLDTLEPRLREAFLLKYGEGLDYRQMSVLTGAGVSALKMRVKRAREAMRPHLEGSDDDRS